MHRFSGLELRSISINTLFQFLVRITGSITTLFVTLLITYFMGLDGVGSFTKVVAFVSTFYLVADFGFNSLLLKKYFKKTEEYIGNLVALRVLISFVLIILVSSIAYALPFDANQKTGFSQNEKMAIVIYSLTVIGFSLNTTLQAYLQRKLSYGFSLIPSLFGNAVLVTIVLLALYSSNFLLLFTAYIVAGSVQALLTYISIRKKYPLTLRTQNLKVFSKDMLLSSWPLGLMLFVNVLYVRADVFLLSFLKPSADVGIYGISYRFFEVALALPTFLSNSTYPLLLKSVDDKKLYNSSFLKYLKLYGVLSIIVMITAFAFAPLIGIVRGEFSFSVMPLQILSLSLPFFFLTSLLQWHFLIRGKLMFLLPLYGTVLFLNVVFNLYFIPAYSYNASAVITGVSEVLVFAVMLWYFVKTIRR